MVAAFIVLFFLKNKRFWPCAKCFMMFPVVRQLQGEFSKRSVVLSAPECDGDAVIVGAGEAGVVQT